MISSSASLFSSTSSSSLHILRGLYRSLKSPPNLETMIVVGKATTPTIPTNYNRNSRKHIKSRSNPTTSYLIKKYREQQQMKNNDTTTNTNTQHELLLQTNIAINTLRLRTDIMERIKLQSLDAGVEEVLTPKEMSRRAAARAGLYLPKQSDYNDNNDNESEKSEK